MHRTLLLVLSALLLSSSALARDEGGVKPTLLPSAGLRQVG
jgi:hypothetical protein